MSRRLSRIIFQTVLLITLFIPFRADADIVFPARLELMEIEPGIFDVYLVLPVINGKVIKAAPRFPEFCAPLEDPQVSGSTYVKETRWMIKCDPRQLYGEYIGIDGLQGSQVTIILEVSTLDGRTYSTTLNPASPYFAIPHPPTFTQLISSGLLQGSNIPLGNLIFILLIFTTIILRPQNSMRVVLFMSSGIMIGYLLAYVEWLLTPGWLFESTALVMTLTMVVLHALSNGNRVKSSYLLLPLFITLILFGAEHPSGISPIGFTETETGLLMVFILSGIALGTGLLYLLIRQGQVVLELITKNQSRLKSALTPGIGILSLGILIYDLSLIWETPTLFPPVPLFLVILSFMIALIFAVYHKQKVQHSIFWVLIPYLAGLALGFWGVTFPYQLEVTLALALLWCIPVYLRMPQNPGLAQLLSVLTALSAGAVVAFQASDSISYPVARTLEFSAIALFSGSLGFTFMIRTLKQSEERLVFKPAFKILLASLFITLLYFMLSESSLAFDSLNLHPQLKLPLLSVIFLIAGIVFWPRKKRVHKDLGVKTEKPLSSLLLFGLALCALPVSSAVNNPWFSSADIDQQQARILMQQVLSNTYTAFNMEDEERLFETLSSNVDDELLDNIYLDSRRRLTMGLREGAEVTVEEVDLDLIGGPENANRESYMSYPATWTVTARVKHLKHIHYRRNRYTGTIEMKSSENSWKISKIILNSEEREVIPSATL